jgi:hypothetical protein
VRRPLKVLNMKRLYDTMRQKGLVLCGQKNIVSVLSVELVKFAIKQRVCAKIVMNPQKVIFGKRNMFKKIKRKSGNIEKKIPGFLNVKFGLKKSLNEMETDVNSVIQKQILLSNTNCQNVSVENFLMKIWKYCAVHVTASNGILLLRKHSNYTSISIKDAIVQATEETCRGEFEAVPPPRNWSVSKLLLKVIEWLRHTAGCSFYQGQCITNDLWILNLRSTGI